MANYKKLTDVEVMENVSENTMALVEENGALKKVPCGAGFGGGKNIVITLDQDTQTVLCNTTYEEFVELFNNNQLPMIFFWTSVDNSSRQAFFYCTSIWLATDTMYGLEFYTPTGDGRWINFKWDSNGITLDNSPA